MSTILTKVPASVATDPLSLSQPTEADVSSAELPEQDKPDLEFSLSQYPWLKTAKLCIEKLSQTTIDDWGPKQSVGTTPNEQTPLLYS